MMSNFKTKVSVIMPVYNDGDYLWDAVDSVITQTFADWELIIVDDGSTDKHTLKVLEDIEEKYKKIIVVHVCNGGPSRARNTGIKCSNGKYILPLDADDEIYPTYLEKAVEILDNNKEIGIVYCEAELIGVKTGKWNLPQYDLLTMLHSNVIFVTALFRKEDWDLVGGYDVSLKSGVEDYDFWLSIIELKRGVFQIPEVLFKYRIKKESRSTRFESNQEQALNTYKKIVVNHRKLYQDNIEDLVCIYRKRETELIYKLERIKRLIPGYNVLSKCDRIKKIIKRLFFK